MKSPISMVASSCKQYIKLLWHNLSCFPHITIENILQTHFLFQYGGIWGDKGILISNLQKDLKYGS